MTDMSDMEERVSRVMDRFEAKLDALAEHVREIREAQIRLDAKNHSGTQDKLDGRMAILEGRILLMEVNHSRQTGMVAALEWFYKLGPWIVATALAVISWWKGWLG